MMHEEKNELYFIKIKNIFLKKDTIRIKYSKNHVSGKGLIARIYKQFLQLNKSMNISFVILKNGQKC